MPDKKISAKKGDGQEKKKQGKVELSMDKLDEISGGYTPGGSSKKKSDPRHHHENP